MLAHFSGNLEDAENALENRTGECASLADYARSVTEETTDIPEHLEYYIDYDAMARDIEMNGDVFTIETGFENVHIFLT